MKGGLACLVAGVVSLAPLNPAQSLYAQDYGAQEQIQYKYSKTLEQKLANRWISEKEKRIYADTFMRMQDALRPQGTLITSYHPSVYVGNKEVRLFLRFEYLHGPRGGSGALRVLIYLGEEAWYEPTGLDNFTVSTFSAEATKISKKVYEINVDYHTGYVNYMPITNRMFESDIVNKKMETGFYTTLKKLKISKKDVNEVLFWRELHKDLEEYHRKKWAIAEGNELIHYHVYESKNHYDGYGSIEPVGGTGKLLRAPKLVEYIIKQGEEAIKGFLFQAVVRYYAELSKIDPRRSQRIRVKHLTYKASLNMEEFAKVLKIRPEKTEEAEEDEKIGED